MAEDIQKSILARSLGVSRSTLYYKPIQPEKDEELRLQIVAVMAEHPAYGCRRIAITLNVGKNRVHRIMKRFGIYPKIKRRKRKYGTVRSTNKVPNRLSKIKVEKPNAAWAGDFTELRWHYNKRLYLATVIDCFTREIIGWRLATHHTSHLVISVLKESLINRGVTPALFHSDQGSEYTSQRCIDWLIENKISPSHSPVGKPWNNGKQESFFSTFKLEFGKASRHETIPLLVEAIGRYIHYYNTRRIHSALRKPPQSFFIENMDGKAS